MPSPCPTVCRRPPLVAAPCTAPDAAADITDPALAADIKDPALAAEPMLKADANEPMDPIDKALPTDPMLSTDPRLAMHRIESSEAMDHFDDIRQLSHHRGGALGFQVGRHAFARGAPFRISEQRHFLNTSEPQPRTLRTRSIEFGKHAEGDARAPACFPNSTGGVGLVQRAGDGLGGVTDGAVGNGIHGCGDVVGEEAVRAGGGAGDLVKGGDDRRAHRGGSQGCP